MAVPRFMNESSPSNSELREAAFAYRLRVSDDALEFPVAPDFDSRPPQLSSADFVAWCEEMLTAFPPKENRDAPELEARCHAEFVL